MWNRAHGGVRAAHLLECGNQQFKTVAGIVECAEREVGQLRLYVSSLPLPEQVSVCLRRRFSLPVPPVLPVAFGLRSLLSGGQSHPSSPLISNFIKSSNLLRKHALNLFQGKTPVRSSKPAVFLLCPLLPWARPLATLKPDVVSRAICTI